MDETHKASKDFYRRRAFARGGLPAHVVMNGPINRQFSILAAMGVDGAISKDEICAKFVGLFRHASKLTLSALAHRDAGLGNHGAGALLLCH